MKTLTFNKIHKNGWISYKLAGQSGAVFIDKRLFTADALATPPATLEEALNSLVEPGADASAAQAEKTAKQIEREAAKALKAEATAKKATERLEKLQASAAAAQARADAARLKASGGAPPPPTESTDGTPATM